MRPQPRRADRRFRRTEPAVSRYRRNVREYAVILPDHFDEDAKVIEAKGWLAGVVIDTDGIAIDSSSMTRAACPVRCVRR